MKHFILKSTAGAYWGTYGYSNIISNNVLDYKNFQKYAQNI